MTAHNVVLVGGPKDGVRLQLPPIVEVFNDTESDVAYGKGGGDYRRTEEMRDGLVVFRFVGNHNSRLAFEPAQ